VARRNNTFISLGLLSELGEEDGLFILWGGHCRRSASAKLVEIPDINRQSDVVEDIMDQHSHIRYMYVCSAGGLQQ
jgi:hypothetical protein